MRGGVDLESPSPCPNNTLLLCFLHLLFNFGNPKEEEIIFSVIAQESPMNHINSIELYTCFS